MMQEESTEQPANQQQKERPWWFRWIQKIACVIAAVICVVTGVVACISFTPICVLAGVLQILFACLVLILEAPCCCSYIDFIDKISQFSDNRPAWQKAIVYCGLPIIPVAMCQGISIIIGNLLVFCCGLSFLFVALGRKASRQEMLENARGDQGLVDNAQPIAKISPPQTNNIV